MQFPGSINEHIIGISMKEAVRRAIVEVRRQRFIFEAKEKDCDYKSSQDYVTTADEATQEIYLKVLKEHFPSYGIVAEEAILTEPCKVEGRTIFFTIDPLDGTKAYIRRQSHGVGTMLALICDNEIAAAYVGDIMTQEIYGYRPGSPSTWRISQLEHFEPLEIDTQRGLAEQYVLLRDAPDDHSETVQRLVRDTKRGGIGHGIEVSGGSFGIGMARLWKGEVGAAVLRPTMQTPWDIYPVVGICRHMGFVFLEIVEGVNPMFRRYSFPIQTEMFRTNREILVVHESRVIEVERWAQGL